MTRYRLHALLRLFTHLWQENIPPEVPTLPATPAPAYARWEDRPLSLVPAAPPRRTASAAAEARLRTLVARERSQRAIDAPLQRLLGATDAAAQYALPDTLRRTCVRWLADVRFFSPCPQRAPY
jgi:hypothetical protein